MSVLLNCEFALSHCVPNFQVLVPTATSDLSVVRRESASEHISGVAHKSSAGNSLFDVPESEGSVPGGGEGVSAVLREGEVLNKVTMT